jgi:hypothetical protein
MKTTIHFRSFSFDDGGGRDTRKRAATWMKETLATLDEKDVLTAQFTEDNTSTTAWVITRLDENVKDIS